MQIIWGSELSPFTLKLLRLYRQAGQPFRFLPQEGSTAENLRYALRRERLVRGSLALTWPEQNPDDEFPLLPFVFGPGRENYYDSSAMALWLDRQPKTTACLPGGDPAARFVTRLIDEYADEFGLYMVHHNRWKVAALDNDAGDRVAAEFVSPAGPLRPLFAHWFAARQTRRLPYLFSVAPAGFRIHGLPKRRQPPARDGFPATHELLETAFARLLTALEALLQKRRWLLGARFTLADASLYGQLGMNLSDPTAAQWMASAAPTTYAWLLALHGPEKLHSDPQAPLLLDAALSPLLREISRVFLPLMQQNLAAYEHYRRQGTTCFNEAAFDRNAALYAGEIDGLPFRHVAKTFQAKVWQNLQQEWRQLSAAEQSRLEALGLRAVAFSKPGHMTPIS